MIIQVWKYNMMEELRNLNRAMHFHNVVSIDSEFPGLLLTTQRNAPEFVLYNNVKYSVDRTNLLQLGITLSDHNDNVFGTWEFNFSFDPRQDSFVPKSVDFLKRNGVDFDKLERDGIDVVLFSRLFSIILSKHNNLEWVTFHGLFDVAFLLGSLTGTELPDTVMGFTETAGRVLRKVVDIKYMARFCKGLDGGEVGLEKVAEILDVKRIGGAHQAGSDSLLTALVYAKIKKMCSLHKNLYLGRLYGISNKIKTQNTFVLEHPPNQVFVSQHPPMPMFVNHPVAVAFNYGAQLCFGEH